MRFLCFGFFFFLSKINLQCMKREVSSSLFVVYFWTESHYVVQASLEINNPLPQSPTCHRVCISFIFYILISQSVAFFLTCLKILLVGK